MNGHKGFSAEMTFPDFPRSNEEIRTYAGHGERMACAIVRKFDMRQLMAFRKLRLALGETRFRDALVEGLDILSHSTGIATPAGWLYDFVRKEAGL